MTTSLTVSEVDLAVEFWNKHEGCLWDFAPHAAAVSGTDTLVLAKRIKRSSDTVEGYRLAWGLYLELIQKFPCECEVWRDELSINHFVSVARKHHSKWIGLIDSANFLQRAVTENISVEDLRNKLPSDDRGDFHKSAARWIKKLDHDFIQAPRLNVPERDGRMIVRAAKLLRARLGRLVKK